MSHTSKFNLIKLYVNKNLMPNYVIFAIIHMIRKSRIFFWLLILSFTLGSKYKLVSKATQSSYCTWPWNSENVI